MLQENERCYIDDSRWFSENLEFVSQVMRESESWQRYYYLTAIQIDTADGYIYSGVILNDDTKELIEFCFERPDEAPKN